MILLNRFPVHLLLVRIKFERLICETEREYFQIPFLTPSLLYLLCGVIPTVIAGERNGQVFINDQVADLADYVTEPFSPVEKAALPDICERAADSVLLWLSGGTEAAMRETNSPPGKERSC